MPWALAQHNEKQGPGLGLAGLQGDAGPAERSAQPHQFPVMGAFVHQQRLARRYAVNVDAVGFPNHREMAVRHREWRRKSRVLAAQPIENRVDVAGIGHRAVEIGGEPKRALLFCDLAHRDQAAGSPTASSLPRSLTLRQVMPSRSIQSSSNTGSPSSGSLPLGLAARDGSRPPTRCQTGMRWSRRQRQVIGRILADETRLRHRRPARKTATSRDSCIAGCMFRKPACLGPCHRRRAGPNRTANSRPAPPAAASVRPASSS